MPQLVFAARVLVALLLAFAPAAMGADEARALVTSTMKAVPLELRGMPLPLALAATWDPALVARVYAAVAAEASAEGTDLVLGPSLEVARDPRRGNIAETFGGDAFLVGEMGVAAIEGLQGSTPGTRGKVVAAATGFAGPGLPRDAAGTAPMSERELRSVYVAPFAQAMERARLIAIVPSRNAVDGIPSHASAQLLRTVLRGELGFTGKVVADPRGIADLVQPYGMAYDTAEAARLARDAGVDVLDSTAVPAFPDAARERATHMPRDGWSALASQAARQAVVLLANDGVLPLSPPAGRVRLALVEAAATAFGDALRARARERVEWVDAASADRVVVVLANAAPDAQRHAVDAAVAAGRPWVVVFAGDRPDVDAQAARRANAAVAAWGLGDAGPEAVAAVLFGDVNPSGKLPVTLARSAGDLPLFHDAKPSSRRGYLFDDGEPLFVFGFGLSYTTFEMSAPRLAKTRIGPRDPIDVTVDVRNAGSREGEETVQVYVRDKVGSVTAPLLRLAAFAKVKLAPGEARELRLTIAPRSLALWDGAMRHVVEPGDFEILAGPDSGHLRAAIVTVRAEGS